MEERTRRFALFIAYRGVLMLLYIVYILIGFFGLYFGGNWLVKSAARLAAVLGMSPLLIGLTVVAAGTSMPELMVSVDAALRGSSEIAIGSVIGSNIANIGLILGLSALITRIPIHITLFRREIPVMIVISCLVFVLASDLVIGSADGWLLFAGILVFNGVLIYLSRREPTNAEDERHLAEAEGITGPINRRGESLRLLAGVILLVIGANWMVEGAVGLALELGISKWVIGVTLVAVGTSLPELVTALVSAYHRQTDILVGNVVGSNIFNLLGILGVTAIVRPIPIDPALLQFDFLVMIGMALALLPFVFRRVLDRPGGSLMLGGYALFIGVTVMGTVAS
jgi:cation:H+ antiporter